MIRKGRTAQPSHATTAANSTSDIAQDCRFWLCTLQALRPCLARRSASRCQADFRLPTTVRGRKAQKVSPIRELAGSSGVATFLWWPRLCST